MGARNLLFVVSALLASVAQAQQAGRDRGAEILVAFKQELQQALREGLARGPVEAISACRERAPEIARGLSGDGIRLGRTSHRLRNPSNVAPEWVRPILESYLSRPSERSPRAVRLGEGRSGYAEPILLQPLCVTCHGQSVAPDLAREIARLYPEDQAVGFGIGELRGVFWVEFPASD